MKERAKESPGYWWPHCYEKSDGWTTWGVRNSMFAIANCVENEENDEPNARLIANAPVMQAVLKEIIKPSKKFNSEKDELVYLRRLARSAIRRINKQEATYHKNVDIPPSERVQP